MSSTTRRAGALRLTAILCVAEAFSMTGFAAFTTLLPQLQREWSLSNSEAGAISGVFFAGYMLSVPVLSSLTDRIDTRKVYALACLVSFAGAAGFGLYATGFVSAMLFQFLIGAALGGTYMPGLKALTDQLEGPVQSRATAFYTAGFGVGSSISIICCGQIAAHASWAHAFLFGAVGPLIAATMMIFLVPQGRVAPRGVQRGRLLDFRPVLRNRATVPYIVGYAIHNYELFGQRSWMVAFLAFSISLQAEGSVLLAAATLAAAINVLGPVFSVTGNELAIRYGRSRIILFFMTFSGAVACVVGFTAAWPLAFVVALMGVHYASMLGDSGALTAGAVASTPPELRGAMMAVYSFIGFTAAFLAPLVFGVVLDMAGGNRSVTAWGWAFASIGIFGVLAPLARRVATRRVH